MNKYNASIGKTYTKTGKEVFTWRRFRGGFFGLLDPIGWAKDIIELLNVRKLALYVVIFAMVAGYFYFQGLQGKPVQVNLGYEDAVEIQVPNSNLRLYKPKNSHILYWIDKEGNKINVKVADIPSLKRALKPYGLIFEPYAITGIGIGMKGANVEAGAGAYFLKYYLARLGLHLTNKGIYVGMGYKLSGLGLNNTCLNVSYGKGYAGDETILFGVTVSF